MVRSFATGAPSLAWIENSGLLVVHALRLGPFHYRVVVDRPIHVDRSISRKTFAVQAVAEFVRRLEAVVEKRPQDWQGWSYWDVARTSVQSWLTASG